VISGLLMVLSMIVWTVLISKVWLISQARSADQSFLGAFHESPHPLAIFQASTHHERSPLYHIYHAACRELAFHLLGTDEPDATFASRLTSAGRITPSQMNAVMTAMNRAGGEAGLRLESRMNAVSIVLAGAPFLGLLGTVWGMMDAMSSVAGAPDGGSLATMSPGICGALLPTLIGLLLAVPGMVAYNLIVGKVRELVARHEHFASEFSTILNRHFVDHRTTSDGLPSIGSLGTPNMPAFGGSRFRGEGDTTAANS